MLMFVSVLLGESNTIYICNRALAEWHDIMYSVGSFMLQRTQTGTINFSLNNWR